MRDASDLFSAGDAVPDGTYAELVRELFRSKLPSAIMAVAFAAIAALLIGDTPDVLLWALGLAGSVAAAARLLVLILFSREIQEEAVEPARVGLIERMFGAPYLGFAIIFGMFAARAIITVAPDRVPLVVALLVGYAAGVAAGASYRPWIGVSAVLGAVVPTILACLWMGGVTHFALATLLLALMIGGIHSMISRYHTATNSIMMRRLFATLARSDGLTGLPNRLALAERFAQASAAAGNGRTVAVHVLDLDRFKPVNDRYGHPVGDLLLQSVAQRLGRILREPDFAARIGGDEFVIVQHDVGREGEAELLARRVVRSLSEPYQIGHRSLEVGASVGFALGSEHGEDLDHLIEVADAALLEAKASGGGLVGGGAFAAARLSFAG